MANTTSISNNSTNQNNASPTGQRVIVNGLRNPSKLNAGANQQINVGDMLIQHNDATSGWIALPATNVTGNNFTSGASNAAANETAIAAMQQQVHNNFAGASLSYRSPKNTSYGKPADQVGVGVGRVKVKVDPTAANGSNGFNSAAAQPIGTPWGVGVACTNPVANNSNCSVQPTVVVCGNIGNQSGAEFSIGRQALPKAANDPYVWLDLVSTVLEGGVQEPIVA